MVLKHKLHVFIFLLCFTTILSCKKKAQQVTDDNIPYQPVDIKFNPNEPLYNLVYVGAWKYINGGVNGIFVYRLNTIGGVADFIAIERTSTHLPNNANAKVYYQTSTNTLRDSVSGSEWQVVDGTVVKGPATNPLRVYPSYYNSSDGILTIKNN